MDLSKAVVGSSEASISLNLLSIQIYFIFLTSILYYGFLPGRSCMLMYLNIDPVALSIKSLMTALVQICVSPWPHVEEFVDKKYIYSI